MTSEGERHQPPAGRRAAPGVMGDLEALESAVQHLARAEAEEILREARRRAEHLTEAAERQAQQIRERRLAAARESAQQIRDRRRGEARQGRQADALQARQSLLDDVFQRAEARLRECGPDDPGWLERTRALVMDGVAGLGPGDYRLVWPGGRPDAVDAGVLAEWSEAAVEVAGGPVEIRHADEEEADAEEADAEEADGGAEERQADRVASGADGARDLVPSEAGQDSPDSAPDVPSEPWGGVIVTSEDGHGQADATYSARLRLATDRVRSQAWAALQDAASSQSDDSPDG